jgi:hypothetical protein
MNIDPASAPELGDDDYVLLQKWAYQAAQQASIPSNEPDFGDSDHTLLYKIADSSFELEQA